MKPHFDRATRNFGSFMCVRNLSCLLPHDTAEVIERGIPSPIVTERHAADETDPLIRKAGKRFGDIPKKIWLKITGWATAR